MVIGIILWFCLISTPVAFAASPQETTDLAQQPFTEVAIRLGNSANEFRFFPSQLTFTAGKRYKLLLTNPSSQKHYFTAKDFADSIWNQKVEAGNVEIKGAIHEVELKPAATAAWFFVPIKSGTYELYCSVPGHAAAGMTGTLTVSSSGQV
ncbi:hypothetical protein DO97_13415 [Neosynechococcus sphagnicola sy1]|uniref:Blue (type 1) copper domain-containing protein n=1 Tax=Neosynechococcus sphagnicola sy1 TaxID=1497020 RepID=A0A098TJ44_9CYAN|nr:hypothetical protein DO97_13415 [Neosynechococcus sphagnicola sy1]